jgi:hypothetical protein
MRLASIRMLTEKLDGRRNRLPHVAALKKLSF